MPTHALFRTQVAPGCRHLACQFQRPAPLPSMVCPADRNDLSHCLKLYLRFHPGAHFLKEGLRCRMVVLQAQVRGGCCTATGAAVRLHAPWKVWELTVASIHSLPSPQCNQAKPVIFPPHRCWSAAAGGCCCVTGTSCGRRWRSWRATAGGAVWCVASCETFETSGWQAGMGQWRWGATAGRVDAPETPATGCLMKAAAELASNRSWL